MAKKRSDTSAPYTRDRRGNYVFSRPIGPDELTQLAISILEYGFTRGELFTSPANAGRYFQLQLGALEHEVFAASFLDNRHRLIRYESLFNGTVNGAAVYPREVAKKALYYNAAAVIFAHNHPSGVAEPSHADMGVTRRLCDTLSLLEVRVLDHFVVSQTEYVSMAERGLL